VNYIILEKGMSEGCTGFQIRDVASFGNLKMDLVISENSSNMMVIFEVYPLIYRLLSYILRLVNKIKILL
jgi:hypothetical protein